MPGLDAHDAPPEPDAAPALAVDLCLVQRLADAGQGLSLRFGRRQPVMLEAAAGQAVPALTSQALLELRLGAEGAAELRLRLAALLGRPAA